MKNKVEVRWTNEMAFEATVGEHKLILDAALESGGKERGPRPKPLTLVALGGCTGMDVISILKKMQVFPDDFRLEIEGELTEEHPKVYHTINLHYIFKGKNLPMEKLEKAVTLSREKYCGVSAMMGKAAKIEHTITVEP